MINLPWKDIPGCAISPLSEEEHMEQWVKAKHEEEQKDLYVLEIGSYHGRSTTMLAQFGEVIAIDLHANVDVGLRDYQNIGQHHYQAFIQNMIRLELIERVHIVTSTSKCLERMPFMNFDIIYIDASHIYEDVKLDIERSNRHLSSKGLMMFDDYKRPGFGPNYGTNDPWEGVARAVDEFIGEGKFEIQEHFEGKVCLARKEIS